MPLLVHSVVRPRGDVLPKNHRWLSGALAQIVWVACWEEADMQVWKKANVQVWKTACLDSFDSESFESGTQS